jgi:hypothetical protein
VRVTIANRDTGCTARRTAVGLIDELEPEADHQFVIHDWRALRGELVAVPRRHSSMVLLPSPSEAVNSGHLKKRVGLDPRALDEADRRLGAVEQAEALADRLDGPSSPTHSASSRSCGGDFPAAPVRARSGSCRTTGPMMSKLTQELWPLAAQRPVSGHFIGRVIRNRPSCCAMNV